MRQKTETLDLILKIGTMILDKIIEDQSMKDLPPFETIASLMLLSVRMGLSSGMSSEDLESLFLASYEMSSDQISSKFISSSH